jgi:putative heme-binding domain-containing protein
MLIPLFSVCGVLFFASLLLRAQTKPGMAPSQTSAANLAEAKTTYESVCASCHGLDAQGSERGPNIASRQEVVDKSDAQLAEILKHGKTSTGMPAFAAFGDARIAALVAYLRTLLGHGDEGPVPGDPASGKALFFGKAQCASCHMVGGQGGFFAHDLTSYAARMNADEVRAKIVNPDKDFDTRRGTDTVILADSSKLSGVVRSEDNFSLQLQTPDGLFHLLTKSEIRTQTYAGKSGMPKDYGATLSPAELNDLVSYLLRASRSKNKKNADEDFDDGDED